MIGRNDRNKKMDKIYIAFCMSGLEGGVSGVIFNYFDHMPRENYEIDIISQGEAKQLYIEKCESRGFHIHMVPSKKESFWGNIKALYNLMHEKKYHIVHAHMTLTNCFPLCVALICGIKVRISHSHLAGYHTISSRILAFLSKIVATDYFACGQDAGKFLFGNAPFIELKNAIDLQEYRCNEDMREQERTNLGIGLNEKVIGHIGRFTRQKNHDFLIDIFECVHSKMPNTKLMLIGDGELEKSIKEKVCTKGLINSVIFCGAIGDVSCKLQAMDLCLFPSLLEGLPLAVIEAQAAGIPCVLSDRISKEVCHSKNVRFESLERGANEWSKVCLALIEGEKCDNLPQLRNAGYDITAEAEKLDKFYRKKLKCKLLNGE